MAARRRSPKAEKDLSERQRFWLKHLRAAERKGDALYAYAARLGLSGPPWRALWGEIADRIEDHADNRNNRFEVAAALNRRLSGDGFPFWGHHPAHDFAGLGRFRPGGYGDGGLAELRLTDGWITGPQPVW